jgi:hypothetical protein
VAHQAIFATFDRVGHHGHPFSFTNLMAHGTTIIGTTRMILRERVNLAYIVTNQAILPSFQGMGHRRDLQQWQSIGRGSNEQQRHQRGRYEHNS